MIDLHYWPTPNGHKITLFLEETGLPYRIVPVDIGRGEQFRPEFLAIAPNNRMPAIVDHAPADGGGPLSLFEPSDIGASGTQAFKGKGDASQSNALSGEVSVTVAAVYPNGTMLVKGEKLLTLNRGDERVQISGIVRAIDVSPDNRVLSTRVANANIRYVGKGEIARASKQGWLQRFFSIISPF